MENININTEWLNYFNYNAKVTLTFFFLSLAVLVLDKITKGKSTEKYFSTERASLLNPITYIRFFTHILGHRDWRHLSGNFMKILLLGPLIEEKYGSFNLLVMILITALVTGIYNFIRNKHRLKGASGIVFMMIVLSAFVNVTANKIPVTLVLIIIFYVIDEILDLKKDDSVSHSGHVIGALCGCVFGFISLNKPAMDVLLNFKDQIIHFFNG